MHDLTFEQREGVAPLPAQLQLKELPRSITAPLWAALYERLSRNANANAGRLFSSWRNIIQDYWIKRRHHPADEFSPSLSANSRWLKTIFFGGDYTSSLGLLEFIVRHPSCPEDFAADIDAILAEGRAAYRVVDGRTIAPVASDAEAQLVRKAFSELERGGHAGARAHLGRAADGLSAGLWADAVRESIHAVEAVARALAPGANTLGPALAELEKRGHLHPAMKRGFSSLYGYTSDEGGIRHALLEAGDPNVTEADALYMFGACAAFITYLSLTAPSR